MTTLHLSATPKTKKQVQEAEIQIAQNVLVWVNDLCNALKNDYIRTSVESYKRRPVSYTHLTLPTKRIV